MPGARMLWSCMFAALAALSFPAPIFASIAPSYDQGVAAFVSAKGEQAAIMGYPTALEVWAYPLQLVSDYHLRFRTPGMVQSVDAATLLRRVERNPAEVVLTYVGPDYVVRERLFTPRKQAGVLIRYEVEGRPDVQIEASFVPSLDLMWPGALGGQSIGWDGTRSGYVEREPLHQFSATIASREAIGHDEIVNRTQSISDRVTMLLQPAGPARGMRTATLALALDTGPDEDGAAALRSSESTARADVLAHSADVLAQSIDIDTPDPVINRALASATLALDQAWACNPQLGCGELAGFGPSRPGRRPQYAWFFGGDGLVAMDAMLDAGQFERARAELAFITRYQDPKTGMIWHEMSQSAGLIDWVGRYPYMYVHVDISFLYLAALKHYLAATGDVAFVKENWPAIEKARRYCNSVIDSGSGLPHIPAGKQGQNEQERLRDDIRLSSLWIDAADGFAVLSASTHHPAEADAARRAATRARAEMADHDWDPAHGFWVSGHTLSGAPIETQRSDAIGVLDQGVFASDRVEKILDRIASPDFLTDWGMRSMAASDPSYDPNLYSAGSVWALGSAVAAETFWRAHRPLVAWRIWRSLVDWNTIDSAGHLPEVLAGDLYHPEREAAPEQTWSSAGLLSSAVHGLLGLDAEASDRTLTIAPHLPATMDDVTVRHIRIGDSRVDLSLKRTSDGITLTIDNPGAPISIVFDPMIPLGASLEGAMVAGHSVLPVLERREQDEHAKLMYSAGQGQTLAHIAYHGGVLVSLPHEEDPLGAEGASPIISHMRLNGGKLEVGGWATGDQPAIVDISSCGAVLAGPVSIVSRTSEGGCQIAISSKDANSAGGGPYRPMSFILGVKP